MCRPHVACKTRLCESTRNRLKIETIGAIDCSKAQRENRAQVRDREPACSAPTGFAFLGRRDPLMLPLLFKAILFGRAGKSGRPSPLEPSLKVQRDIVHNHAPGLLSPPGQDINARAPLRVHPKWCLGESALAAHALAPVGRHIVARLPDASTTKIRSGALR